jgi:hypothetical protein
MPNFMRVCSRSIDWTARLAASQSCADTVRDDASMNDVRNRLNASRSISPSDGRSLTDTTHQKSDEEIMATAIETR